MKDPIFGEFLLEEYKLRVKRARELMEKEKIDALLLTQMENVRYISGYLSILWISKFRPLLALLPLDENIPPALILPGQEYGNSRTSWMEEVKFYPDQEDPVKPIVETLHGKGLKGKKVGVELGYGTRLGMAQVQWEELVQTFEGQFVDNSSIMQQLRVIKSNREIEALREACKISCIGVEAGWHALQEGMSEKELGAIMVSRMMSEGAEQMRTFLCINAGPQRYQTVNSPPSDYRLKKGDMVMIDGGATYKGYATDFIRQACLGKPTGQQQEWFDIAKEANDAVIKAIRPGVPCYEVYDAGIKVFEKAGLAQYSVLNIVGHSSGMEVHELPYVGDKVVETSDTIIEKGMVFNIEPVIAGMDSPTWEAGVFIQEEVVAVTESGCEVLTSDLSKELWIAEV